MSDRRCRRLWAGVSEPSFCAANQTISMKMLPWIVTLMLASSLGQAAAVKDREGAVRGDKAAM